MYKYIVFDLDNTLLDYEQSEWEAMRAALRKHEIDRRPGFELESFWDTFTRRSAYYWQRRDELKLGGLSLLEHALLDTLGQGEQALVHRLAQSYWNHFCTACYYEPDAPGIVRWAAEHYTLGVISNGIGDAQRRRLKSAGLYDLFTSLLFSDEVGRHKPDPYIFEQSMQQLGADREEVLYIGDSLHDDFIGAANAGTDFCHYNRQDRPSSRKGPMQTQPELSASKPKYTIGRLRELRTQLE